MKNIYKSMIVIFLIFSLTGLISCGKSSNSEGEDRLSRSGKAESKKRVLHAVRDRAPGRIKSKMKEADWFKPAFTEAVLVFKKRPIEYQVNLTYQSSKLTWSRQQLIEIIKKYGGENFIKSSSVNTSSRYPYMSINVHIKVEKLYEILTDMGKVGKLLSETIRTTDHTENLAWNKIKIKREQLRGQRRALANRRTNPAAKNWSVIENSLSGSEDAKDKAEFKKWKIGDRVKWAKVQIYLKSPVKADEIVVPNFGNALKGALNFLLQLLYGILYLLPMALIICLLVWKRKLLFGWLKRKKS